MLNANIHVAQMSSTVLAFSSIQKSKGIQKSNF